MAGTPNVPNGGRAPANLTIRGRSGYREDGSKAQIDIGHQAAAWSTPRATDGEKGGPNMSFGAGGTPLPAMAANWPTPVCADGGEKVTLVANQPGLIGAATNFQPSLPAPPIPAGPPSSSERRSLNPLFVEWLMGWPAGLSGFERAETAWFLWWRRMRICLSQLRSRPTEPDGQGRLL